MEQYIHTLIAVDPSFAPNSLQIASYLKSLVDSFQFQVIDDSQFQPGIRVVKPSNRLRTFRDSLTGEAISVPANDRIKVDTIAAIPAVLGGLDRWSVLVSGAWNPESSFLHLLTADRVLFQGEYLCEVSCHLRPQPVSTSYWAAEATPEFEVAGFGTPCADNHRTGVFSHPWTGEVIQVPEAGCARFWIEFEFGKFLLPRMTDSLDLLNPALVSKARQCFQKNFAQGWRGN
jgi:hypothetical protein